MKNTKSLAETHPDLAKQWHPTKNGDLTPNNVTPGSSKKVWWKCDKGDDHEWIALVYSRSKGIGCSVCSGRTIVLSNCLATINPKLAKEWHPTKNGDLTQFDVGSGSAKKVWWKCCEGDDHEWEASIDHRKRRGCPFCSGQKVVKSNCLETTHPKLAKEWHPTKNGDLTQFDVVSKSNKEIWWKCNKGDDHEWTARISSRSSGDECSICAGRTVVNSNCLATTHPEIAKEWHLKKNGELTPSDIIYGTHRKVWWKCDEGDDHEWNSTPSNRSTVCPYCMNIKVSETNSLQTLFPHLAMQWHPTKNGSLTPNQIISGSPKRVWWKCKKGDDHEWQTTIVARKNQEEGYGCPFCYGRYVSITNSLESKYPKLAKQWHPILNGSLTPDKVTPSSHKTFWWKCDKGDDHEWRTEGAHSRIKRGDGCPFCTLTPQSRQELTITFELIKFFKDINPKGFKTRVKGKLWSIDIYIPQLKLGIEFDGSYWHKGKREFDKLKTKQLKEEGLDVIRIREQSKAATLKKITKNDVISKMPFNGKEVANKVLKQIMKMYELDAKKIAKIEAYIAKKEPQNEKGLDKYIDMILTEKAEKKQLKNK